MCESFATKIDRIKFNFFPAYRGTGARVIYISDDYREIRVKIPLSWRTRNYVGTIYGGSMYTGIDPIYMLMLIKNLGKNYIVWDKAAAIRFKRLGKEALFAEFHLTENELSEIKEFSKVKNRLTAFTRSNSKTKTASFIAVSKRLYTSQIKLKKAKIIE